MNVTIELRHGPRHDVFVWPHQLDAQIETCERLAGKGSMSDMTRLIDTASILRGIKRALERNPPKILERDREVVEALLAILRDYPAGQDDGSWVKRRDAALQALSQLPAATPPLACHYCGADRPSPGRCSWVGLGHGRVSCGGHDCVTF